MIQARIKTALAAASPLSVTDTDYKARGFHLDVVAAPARVVDIAAVLDREGFYIEMVTGVDWLGEQEALKKEAAAKAAAAAKARAAAAAKAAEAAQAGEAVQAPPVADAQPEEPLPVVADKPDEMEVVYDFNHYEHCCRVALRTRIPRGAPELPTISGIYPGADWHERETHDFFGIVFTGHPCLEPLLLPEDADFHPLRKDYKP